MTDRVKDSTHAETLNGEAPRKPRVTAGEIALALASKEPIGRSETLEISCPTTGALAGQFFPKIALSREQDETMEQWQTRADLAFVAAFKKCLVYNAPEYRDELLREALAELRNPEKVTT